MKITKKDSFQADICAERLKALGEPIRLRMVDFLMDGESTVTQISAYLEVGLANVSHHLKILRQAHIVNTRRDGRCIYYRLHDDISSTRSRHLQTLNLGCCTLQAHARTSSTGRLQE